MPEIVLAASVTINGIVAPYEALQCPSLEDLPHFLPMIEDHAVIVGRKTHEHLKQPLLGKRTIVMSRTLGYCAGLCEVSSDIHDALRRLRNHDRIFVIGGPRLFDRMFHQADRLCITQVNAILSGRSYFPEVFHNDWTLVSQSPLLNQDADTMSYRLIEYVRRP